MAPVAVRLVIVVTAVLVSILADVRAAPFTPMCDECNINMACSQQCYDATLQDYSYCELYTAGQCLSEAPGEEPVFGDPAPDPDEDIADYEEWAEGAEANLDNVGIEGGDEPSVAEGGSEAYWETYQSNPLPSCRLYTKVGSVGKIFIQANPAIPGNVQWAASMNKWWENWGVWLWATTANMQPLDDNFNNLEKQWYPPHHSYTPPQTNPGDVFGVAVWHAYFRWQPYCGWELDVRDAHGVAVCIVP
jgi:hypothetical protein